MKNFRITWSIDVEADNYLEAVKKGVESMPYATRPENDTTATIFEVVDEKGRKKVVDILDENPFNDEPKKFVGYQVIHTKTGDIHPYMDASFCIYSRSQANEMLNKGYELVPIYEGDIEDATFMFNGDPEN